MICVKCHQASTSVTNSRPHKKQASVWRRRRCDDCGYVFTTAETPSASDSLELIYRDGSNTPFSQPRLTVSLAGLLAHHKEKAADEAHWLSETVYQTFMKRGNGGDSVPMHEFLTTTHQVLERFDALAGLQFATKHQLVENIRKATGRPRLKRRD